MTTVAAQKSRAEALGVARSIVYFAVPALLLIVGVHGVMPWFNEAFGTPAFYGYFIAVAIPLAGMLLASLFALQLEGRPLTWPILRQRFRLHAMDRRAWLWTLVTIVAAYALTGVFTALNGFLLARGLISVPLWVPAFLAPAGAQMEGSSLLAVYDAAFGGLSGNWGSLLLYLVLLFLNILGEEFWWRGYILPRQEVALGRRAWLVHGLLWWGFHAFKWWDLLPILPVTLLISYVAQRTQNTMPGIISHALFNGVALIPLLLAVSGLLS